MFCGKCGGKLQIISTKRTMKKVVTIYKCKNCGDTFTVVKNK